MLETPSHNPQLTGVTASAPQPCTLVILGGVGDLARRKLLPALYNLHLDGVLPKGLAIVGFGRRELADDGYRTFALEAIERYSRRPIEPEGWWAFAQALSFVRGTFEGEAAFAALVERLPTLERACGLGGGRVFYLAVPPTLTETCVEGLAAAGLVGRGERKLPFARVIVEKPIGRDLESARRVNAALSRFLHESETFRIDHYLGKETVQNILVMRFGNAIFEPLWNAKHIDHVQITVAEREGVGTRAGYYDQAGALRDMVQNHILQLVSLTAMEPPWAMTADVVRDNKVEVLNCLRTMTECEHCVVRAQYAAGRDGDEAVPGYRDEQNVPADSTTETYVAIKLFIDNWRWAGVPFYIRTGKRLPQRATEIAVQFKDVPPILFNLDPRRPVAPNVLALRIQPDEGLSLRIAAKQPGPKVQIRPVEMDFRYDDTFDDQPPEAYERLLLDVMAGDATLFMRRDEVEASWTWITNILESWAGSRPDRLPEYVAGSWGPVEAERLIESNGRRWRVL